MGKKSQTHAEAPAVEKASEPRLDLVFSFDGEGKLASVLYNGPITAETYARIKAAIDDARVIVKGRA